MGGPLITDPPPNPSGLCQCGCGGITPLAKRSLRQYGWVKGEHRRFMVGHSKRTSGVDYLVDDKTGCWVWQLYISPEGYGRTKRNGQDEGAHRVYYSRRYGPIPKGMHIHHECANRACVNPDHLRAVTPAEHRRLDAGTQRQSHCRRGHAFTPENTRINKHGHQVCRTCAALRERLRRARNPEAVRAAERRQRAARDRKRTLEDFLDLLEEARS